MPRVYINREAFELVERRGRITPEEMAAKFGILKGSAANWLSRMTKAGYLTRVPDEYVKRAGRPGSHYVIGPKWWGDKVFDSGRDY